ncbi:MAG: TonB family protein [Terricaulis sp.]
MSNHSSHDDDSVARATTVHARRGGSAGKWLLGGLVAVVLGGAGYVAWKNSAPSTTPQTQTAYNDPYADTQHAGPLPSLQTPSIETPASPSESVAPASTLRATSTHHASRNTVHEETIGITPASATTADAEDENIIVNAPPRPTWTRVPSARRLSALYPVAAQEQGREGEASLHCTVQKDGALDCAPVSQTRGFGNAALRVAGTFRHAPQFADGSNAIGAPLNLRVVFRLPPEDQRG